MADELPADVTILSLVRAPQRFHARHDAVARSYLYQISTRRTAFAKPYVWWVRESLRVERMRDVANVFTGLHDFRSFTAADPGESPTNVSIEHVELAAHGPLLLVRIRGSHFLWRMVRRLVGVMVAVGRGELGALDVARMLETQSDIPAPLTAPASGLFLERVHYPGDDGDAPIRPAVFSAC